MSHCGSRRTTREPLGIRQRSAGAGEHSIQLQLQHCERGPRGILGIANGPSLPYNDTSDTATQLAPIPPTRTARPLTIAVPIWLRRITWRGTPRRCASVGSIGSHSPPLENFSSLSLRSTTVSSCSFVMSTNNSNHMPTGTVPHTNNTRTRSAYRGVAAVTPTRRGAHCTSARRCQLRSHQRPIHRRNIRRCRPCSHHFH